MASDTKSQEHHKVEGKESTLKALFDSTPILAVHPIRNSVVTVNTSQKPLEAFKILIDKGILSAPVVDNTTHKYAGFLDIRDLVAYVVQSYDYHAKQKAALKEAQSRKRGSSSAPGNPSQSQSHPQQQQTGPAIASVSGAPGASTGTGTTPGSSPSLHGLAAPASGSGSTLSLAPSLTKRPSQDHGKAENKDHKQGHHARQGSKEFLENVLSEGFVPNEARESNPEQTISVKYLSGRNRFVPVEDSAKLTEVASILSHKDMHRVPVVDKDGKLLDIISQSALVHFIQSNAAKLTDALTPTLEKLGLARKTVVSVKAKDSTISVFRTINAKNLFGVAVVDNEGKIVANTSSSDLKLFLSTGSHELLDLPVLEYLNIIRRASLKEGAPVVCVTPHDTLGKCIGKLAATKMHRIFVVDAQHKPVGVVSLRDIINACLQLSTATSS